MFIVKILILLNIKLKWTHTLYTAYINRIDILLIDSSFTRFETDKTGF
jgi:hypothetical protein